MEKSNQSGTVKIRPLGGVNERVSPIDLPPSEFSEVKGLFPSQDGLLERIWGNKFLTKLDEAIISISPIYNSKGHIIIQTATKRYLTTLDELFERNEYTSDLTPITEVPGNEITEEEDFPLAIIIGTKANSITGSIIGTAYTTRSLDTIPLNESSIVPSFAANVFSLGAGTFRIKSACCNCNTVRLDAQQLFIHRLAISGGSYLFEVTGSGTVTAASGLKASTPARTDDITTNVWTFHTGSVTLSGSTDIVIQSKTNSVTVVDGAAPVQGKPAALGEDEVYTIIEIWKTA